MSKNTIIAIVVIIVLVLGIGFYFLNTQQTANINNNPTSANPSTTPTTNTETTPNQKTATQTINIQNFAFSPSTLTINIGDTIIWTNQDSAPHTVTSDSGTELNSNSLSNGQTYSHKFTTAGNFAYHCAFHQGMKATIIVK